MTIRILIAAMVSAGALAACGGGGDGADASAEAAPSTTPTAPTAPANAVSAPFKAGTAPGVAAFGAGFQSTGVLSSHTQRGDGAVTKIGDRSLGGEAVVRDVKGDADFAMGRWAAGTHTTPSRTETLTEPGAGVHYLLYNRLASLPTTGTATCDSGAFTAPGHVGGTAVNAADIVGSASGTASIKFTAEGAAITLTITAKNSNSTGTGNFGGSLDTPTSSYIAGGIGTGVSSGTVSMGSSTGNAFHVLGGYTINLSSGARYTGVFKFRCA